VLVMGDVVATGVTIENGFAVLLEHLKRIEGSIRAVVFFTIGCHKLEKQLTDFDAQLRRIYTDYEGAHAIYMESKLKLVDSKTRLRICLQGTDLIRLEGLLAPEFEASQYENVCYPLERCSIYDAGSRAFDTPAYVSDVAEYWGKVRELAGGGFTLHQALKERWPEVEYASREKFVKAKRDQWLGVTGPELDEVYESYLSRWTESFKEKAGNAEALTAVCDERIATFDKTLGEKP
jgi:hypothetical protein